ncbi:MAG: M15 family metallopeptidase [Saprospiraceae bacterium]
MRYWTSLLLAAFSWACQSDAHGSAKSAAANPVALTVPVPTDTLLPADQIVDNAYLLGKFDPATQAGFVTVGKPYTDRSGMWLRKETFEAFKKMFDAAQKEGISLRIISSTRTFSQQKAIWEGKWERFAKDAPLPKDRALKILEYSSMPGSSRHHWGTDMDLNDLNNPSFEPGGKYEKVYTWLVVHAQEYGFGQPYTAGRPSGYHEEKWHWSYLPLSRSFLAQYRQRLHEKDIEGFLGAETATEIGIVKNYVLGINPACQ